MNKKNYVIILMFLLFLMFAKEVFADQRSYVWTYEYNTVEKGKAELESYFTLSAPDMGKIKERMSAEHQIELDVGMNDRFDFSVYQRFSQSPNEQFIYDGLKLRARYKLVEKERLFIDPLIYAEYKGKPNLSEHGIELKLILAKDIGKFNISTNPILEIEIEDDDKKEIAMEIALPSNILDIFVVRHEAPSC